MRALLGVALDQASSFEAAFEAAPDALLLDLQAMVAEADKDAARANLVSLCERGLPVKSWVRIAEPAEEAATEADLDAAVHPGIVGVALPELEGPEEVRQLDVRLGALERQRGIDVGSTEIMPFAETALAVHRLFDILSASPRVTAVLFASGPGGDLNRDVGYHWTPEGSEIVYMRQKVVLESRAATVPHIVDGGWMLNVDDVDAFEQDCRRSRRMGYTGRFAFNPAQAAAAHRAYTPPPEEIEAAETQMKAWAEARSQGVGAIEREGLAVNSTTVAYAEKVLAQAGRDDAAASEA